jgi:hypothetical protein
MQQRKLGKNILEYIKAKVKILMKTQFGINMKGVNRWTLKNSKKYARNLDAYSALEVDEFSTMTEEELEKYQDELETNDGDNCSGWDRISEHCLHIRFGLTKQWKRYVF